MRTLKGRAPAAGVAAGTTFRGELSSAVPQWVRLVESPQVLDMKEVRGDVRTSPACSQRGWLRGFSKLAKPLPLCRAIKFHPDVGDRNQEPGVRRVPPLLGRVFTAEEAPAREAFRAEPDLVDVQTSQALLNFWLEGNWPEAERTLRDAIAPNPAYPLAHFLLANVFSHTGRYGEAQDEIRRARELDPLDPIMSAISSQLTSHARDYPRAAEHARQDAPD